MANPDAWDTATEWDAGVDPDGVVHESEANTDHSDASILQKGYRYSGAAADMLHDPFRYWPLNGNAAELVASDDGTVTGAVSTTGLLGTSALLFDGSDDVVDLPAFQSTETAVTFGGWFRCDTDGSEQRAVALGNGPPDISFRFHDGGTTDALLVTVPHDGGGGALTHTGADLSNWNHVVVRAEQNTRQRLYVNGSQVDEVTSYGTFASLGTSSENHLGTARDNTLHYDGAIWDARYYNEALSLSQIQDIYGVVADPQTYQTSVKTI